MNQPKEGDRAQRGDREILTEQELRDVYYDPSEGYQSAAKLYQKAKEKGLNVSRKSVKNWLKTQDTYSRYKPIVRKHKIPKNLRERSRRSNAIGSCRYGKIRKQKQRLSLDTNGRRNS